MGAKERIAYIDVAKGAAMLLVIIGHCNYAPMELMGFLYSFHMPLFFALSGLTFRPERYKNLKEVVTTKFRTLVIPYLWLSVISWMLCFVILERLQPSRQMLRQFVGIAVGCRLTDYFFSLWFLQVLFLAEPLLYLVLRLTQEHRGWRLPAAAAAFAVGAFVLSRVRGTYWSADLVPIALSFLLIGYLLREAIEQHNQLFDSLWLLLLAWGVNALFGYMNFAQVGRSDLYYCKLGNPLYFFLAACGGTVGMLALCRRIGHCRALEFIGRNSLVYYAFHDAPVLMVAVAAVSRLFAWVPVLKHDAVGLVLAVTLTCAALAVMSVGVMRWCPFVVGKPVKRHTS